MLCFGRTLRQTYFRKYSMDNTILSPKSDANFYDVSIVGGGIIGTAIGRDITQKDKDKKVLLIEKENGLGKHQSSHNSGVIHSGVYYRPNSLKGKFSRKGVDLILKYCEEHKIPHKISGKLIVATNSCKLSDLRTLHDRGVENNVEGLEMLWTKDKIRHIEPKCNGIQAIWCPKVGNINWEVVTESFGKDFEKSGGQILLNNQVKSISKSDTTDHPLLLKTKENHYFKTKYLILCGGLQSDVLSNLIDAESKKNSTLISLKVDYKLLESKSITTNIYGVPDLTIPFLGVHVTPRLDGGMLLGPNAVPALDIEGYRDDAVSLSYLKNTISSTGFQNMTRRYFPQCFGQVKKALCPQFQVEELQSLVEMKEEDIKSGPTAVLGQLISEDGSFVDDFRIEFFQGDGIGSRIINCRFLPSPAATCSLAIADYVTENLLHRFQT